MRSDDHIGDDVRRAIDATVKGRHEQSQEYSVQECIKTARECFGEYQRTMLGLIDDGDKANQELGVLFCESPGGEISLGRMCSGTSCSVSLIDCEPHKMIGDFHTHPTSGEKDREWIRKHLSTPSRADVKCLLVKHLKFMMIGSRQGGIRCYGVDYSSQLVRDAIQTITYVSVKVNEQVRDLQRLALKMINREVPPDIRTQYGDVVNGFAFTPASEIAYDRLTDHYLPGLAGYAGSLGMMGQYNELTHLLGKAKRDYEAETFIEEEFQNLYFEIELR